MLSPVLAAAVASAESCQLLMADCACAELQQKAAAAEAEQAGKLSPFQGQTSPQAASDTSAQTVTGSLPLSMADLPTDTAGLSSALLEPNEETGIFTSSGQHSSYQV